MFRYRLLWLLVGCAVAAAGWYLAGPARSAWGRSIPAQKYIFLHVVESNNQALAAIPVYDRLPPPVVTFNADRGALRLSFPEDRPGARTQAVIFYEVRLAGERIFARTVKADAFPVLVPLAEPVFLQGLAYDDRGSPLGPREVVDNERRLFKDNLVIEGADWRGMLTCRLGGETFTLKPEEGWDKALILDGDRIRAMYPDENWESEMRTALASGAVVSKLSVYHYGIWDQRNVSLD